MNVRTALVGALIVAGVISAGAACGGPEGGDASGTRDDARESGSGGVARSEDAESTKAASGEAAAMETTGPSASGAEKTTGPEKRERTGTSGGGEGRAKKEREQPEEARRRESSPEVVVVRVEGLVYKPSQVEVPVGATVRWVNEDPADHTVTSEEEEGGPLQSRVFGEEGSFEYTFKRPGEFRYFCEVHPFMKGTVLVGR